MAQTGTAHTPTARTPTMGPMELEALRRLEHVRDVLERARTVVERGWLQHGWYVARSRPRSFVGRLLLGHRSPVVEEVGEACLVGAVAVAAHGGGERSDVVRSTGPVLDVVWDALQESAGRSRPAVAGRAAPREVRVARMRELVRWNDDTGRTRDDVLALLDRAISRTIMTAMEGGAGPR